MSVMFLVQMCVVMYSRHENFELSVVQVNCKIYPASKEENAHREVCTFFFQNIASVKTILLIHGVVLATYMFHCLL